MHLLDVHTPAPLQVLQRDPSTGTAGVRIAGTGAPAGPWRAEAATELCPEAVGTALCWTPVEFELRPDGAWVTTLTVPAGVWYRLHVRLLGTDDPVLATGTTDPCGVGDVLVVAGQSYAYPCHERAQVVRDPMGRVVAASPELPRWRIAHDPQPTVSSRVDRSVLEELQALADGMDRRFPHGFESPFIGSIWPPVGDALVAAHQVPVAFLNVSVGGTRVGQWQPGSQLCANLCDAIALAGDVRAVLWQQGESDAMADTSTDDYARHLRTLRDGVVAATGVDRPWVLAKSTFHNTAIRTDASENRIRAAVDVLTDEPGFVAGPDTDQLRSEVYRAGYWRGGHFTDAGQIAAAALWVEALLPLLAHTPAGRRP